MKTFLLAFVPLFVAIDVLGVIPFYLAITGKLDGVHRRRILLQALLTAWLGGVAFTLLGTVIFDFLGITVSDFKVAGGIILLVLAIYDLLFASASREVSGETVGVVPLGMPLIVGPAVLTTLLIQADAIGMLPALLAFSANLVIVLGVFLIARRIGALVGQGGMQAISRIATLLLAAIGVMMIRRGLTEILQAAQVLRIGITP